MGVYHSFAEQTIGLVTDKKRKKFTSNPKVIKGA
jgi:hypothetical protein